MSDLDRVHLEEMIAAIDALAGLTMDTTEADWGADPTQVAAASMFLIIIGEGARLLSQDLKGKATSTPWSDIVGLRNRLAHGYFRASPQIIWRAASERAPGLRPVLLELLADLGPEPN